MLDEPLTERTPTEQSDNAAEPETAPMQSVRRSLISRIPMSMFWALAAQSISSITRLFTSVTVGGRFGSGSEQQLGYYSSAFGLLMILIGLHEAFVTTPLTVFNQKKSESERKTFSGNMLISSFLVIGSIAAVTGILIAIQSGFELLKPEIGAALVIVAALAPLQLLREFSRRWLLANLAVKASALMECVFALMYFVGLGFLVYTSSVSAVWVFVAIGLANAIGLAIWWSIYSKEFQFKQETSAQVGENFRYGRWVAGENVCSTLTMYLCIWILMLKVDEAAAGVFFACFTIMMLANPFLLGASSLLAPRAAQEFVNHGWAGLRRILMNYGIFIVGILLLFACGLSVCGAWLTELFFSSKYAAYFDEFYEGKNTVTATLGFAMPLLGMSFVLTTGLLATNRPQDSFGAALVGLVTLVVANFSFANPNLQTAAISFLISISAAMLCRLFFLIRAYRKGTSAAVAAA